MPWNLFQTVSAHFFLIFSSHTRSSLHYFRTKISFTHYLPATSQHKAALSSLVLTSLILLAYYANLREHLLVSKLNISTLVSVKNRSLASRKNSQIRQNKRDGISCLWDNATTRKSTRTTQGQQKQCEQDLEPTN